jgi:membrane protein DedA with SNARE-associated domain
VPDLGAIITAWLARLDDGASTVVGLFIAGSAALEHLFPPYPGDLAVAFGAAVGMAKRWSLPALFLAAMVGSLVGSALTFFVGRWLAARPEGAFGPRIERLRAAVLGGVRLLQARGVLAIVLSRFVPVGRAVVIVAAGYAGVPPGRALLAAVAGAALWNAVLFTVGGVVGAEHARIVAVLSTYGRVVGAVLVVLLTVWAVRWWRRRRERLTPT